MVVHQNSSPRCCIDVCGRARCSNSCPQTHAYPKKAADAVGTVRCRRSLHGPRHRPSGTWLSSGIMPASPVAAPTTRAPDHLDPLLARGTRTSVRQFCEPGDHSSCSGNGMTCAAHTPPYRVCAARVKPLTSEELASPGFAQSISSLTAAGDRGAAQSLHMSGARAAEASEALGLTSVMAWLGRVPRWAAGGRGMCWDVCSFRIL